MSGKRNIVQFTPKSAFLNFSLQGTLPEGQLLILNTSLGTFTLCSADGPTLLWQVQFTDAELSVLLPLLDHYPAYCPHEVLLASFQYRNTQKNTIERCREFLNAAIEEGVIDQVLRPLRNMISRMRLKLTDVGFIQVLSILETGYILHISLIPTPKENHEKNHRRATGAS